eukprot:2259662-Pyramimonas_sp.AAC.1
MCNGSSSSYTVLGIRADGVGGSCRIANTYISGASAMYRRRRRHTGAVGVEKSGLHIRPHRRCIGGAA